MRVLLALAFVCLCGIVAAQTPTDACAFSAASSAGYDDAWLTTKDQLLACFHSVPFNPLHRDTMVSILNYTWEAYSFHDYVAQPIAPYNVQVRIPFGFLVMLALYRLLLIIICCEMMSSHKIFDWAPLSSFLLGKK